MRKAMSERLDMGKVLHEQLSGTGILLEDILEARREMETDYTSWEKEELIEFLGKLLKIAKPTIIVANKADLPTSAKILRDCRKNILTSFLHQLNPKWPLPERPRQDL